MKTCLILTIIVALLSLSCLNRETLVSVSEITVTGVANDAFLGPENNVSFYCYVVQNGIPVNIAKGLAWDEEGSGKFQASIVSNELYKNEFHSFMFTFTEDGDERFMFNLRNGVVDQGTVCMTPALTFASLKAVGFSQQDLSDLSSYSVLADRLKLKAQQFSEKDRNDALTEISNALSAVNLRYGFGSLDPNTEDIASDERSTVFAEALSMSKITLSEVAEQVVKIADTQSSIDVDALSEGLGLVSDEVSDMLVYWENPITEEEFSPELDLRTISGNTAELTVYSSYANLDTTLEVRAPGSESIRTLFSAELSITGQFDFSGSMTASIIGTSSKSEIILSQFEFDINTQKFRIPSDSSLTVNYYPNKNAEEFNILFSTQNPVSEYVEIQGSGLIEPSLPQAVAASLLDAVFGQMNEDAYSFTLNLSGFSFKQDSLFDTVNGKVQYIQ